MFQCSVSESRLAEGRGVSVKKGIQLAGLLETMRSVAIDCLDMVGIR